MPEMKTYLVTIPVVGSIVVAVEADSPETAREIAFDKQDWKVVCGPDTEAQEFEAVAEVTRGNVCYAPVNEVFVEESSL